MAEGNGKTGCFILIIIGIIVSSVMTCTSKCSASSAVSSYKKGNYQKAISKFEKIEEAAAYDLNATELYVYAELLKKENPSESRNLKIEAYNKLIDSDSEVKKFKKKLGASTYQELLEWEKKLTNLLGFWEGDLLSFKLNQDNTLVFYVEGVSYKEPNAYWKYDEQDELITVCDGSSTYKGKIDVNQKMILRLTKSSSDWAPKELILIKNK